MNRWYVKNVKIDPYNSIQFKDCYFSYLNYALNEMEVAPCSKKFFGTAIRNNMRKLLDNGNVLKNRTSGLRFYGIKIKDIDSDRSRLKERYQLVSTLLAKRGGLRKWCRFCLFRRCYGCQCET